MGTPQPGRDYLNSRAPKCVKTLGAYAIYPQMLAPKQTLLSIIYLLPILFLLGCGESQSPTAQEPNIPPATTNATENTADLSAEPTAPLATLAPLQPTFTPAGQSATSSGDQIVPTSTGVAQLPALATIAPTVDLDSPVLSLTYQIPAVELNRQLTANVAGRILLTDLTTGKEVAIPNGQRFLTEIVGAIEANKTLFEPVPADCAECVVIGFELPAAGESGLGILPDPQLQVSIQHLFATRLGPHFPPEIALGHHRSASGYTVAHTAAIMADGQLFSWIASDPKIKIETGPIIPEAASEYESLLAKFDGVPFVTECPNFPNETLVAGAQTILIRCPQLAIGHELTAVYAQASNLSNNLLVDERNLAIPDTSLPFGARIFYTKTDGRSVTIYADGLVEASYPVTQTETISGTEQITFLEPATVQSSIPPGELEPLIIPLLASDVIPRGVTASVSQEQTEFEELILIRGADGVYEFAWSNGVGQELLPGIQILDLLIERLEPTSNN